MSTDNRNKKLPYVAPQLTVVDFKMERGYASSGMKWQMIDEQNFLLFEFDQNDQSQDVSQFGYDNRWADNGWN